MPTFLSVSSLLWLAFIAIYFRMMVEWKGQGLMSWDAEALIAHGALWPPAFWEGQYWRIGTANFLHIGWLHVFFNTAGLSQVGPAIEDVYGRGRMVFFFVLTGVLAMLASAIFNPGALTAGASGALMGLIGVAAGWGHRSKTSHGRNVRDQMIKWGVYTMLFGIVMRANHVAHAAGFIVGAVIGYAYPTQTLAKTKGSPVSIALGIVGGLTCGVLVLLALVPPGSSRAVAAEFRKPKFLDQGVSSEREFRVAIANACRLRDSGNLEGALRELERAGGTDDLTEHELNDTCAFLEHMKKECVRYREGGLDAVYPREARGDAQQVKAISDYYRLWCTEKK
ncbi:MAG: rhomboid family intramembrane serine protease [Polyangiaceae bacterium]|nr:rhomboid family intramembrane serine protease [Polyangiaceae bacterium]